MQRLLDYKEKLVLFPKTAGKAQKGEIDDTTTEALADLAIEQTLNREVLPVVKPTKKEKAIVITDEMKNSKVYQKIRTERMNKRFAGIRKKRAEEAAKKE